MERPRKLVRRCRADAAKITLVWAAALLCSCWLPGCSSATSSTPTSAPAAASSSVLGSYTQTGNVSPVRDPSILRQGSTYYVFSTDAIGAGQTGFLPIRCSQDENTWSACGYVFSAMPAWIKSAVPGATNLWAPDISYFNGQYHLYYAASTLFSQVSAIGLATNTTLDPTSPAYQWVDQGAILTSTTGDDFNAIDPNILVDDDGLVWLNYGSFWTGIKQQQVDQATGKLSTSGTTTTSLAYRPLLDHAVEGASMVHHGDYYYLFVSTGHCCEANYLDDDYQEAVGRATSPQGPFLDQAGVDLESGGGTVLLSAGAGWNAPGGATAYVDPVTGGSVLVFHALHTGPDPTGFLWVKQISWPNDWPVLEQTAGRAG